jgi:hypothetical protein
MLNSYIFGGLRDDIALVISGVHGSELSGIEVANWMRAKMQRSQVPPTFTTIIIPEVFPEQARIGREFRLSKKLADEFDDTNNSHVNGRYVKLGKEFIELNRQFPRPGEPLSSLTDRSAGGQPLLSETRELLRLIEVTKPVRIASIHSHSVPRGQLRKGTDGPGIFVDPRYTFGKNCLRNFSNGHPYNVNLCKFDLAKDPAFPKCLERSSTILPVTQIPTETIRWHSTWLKRLQPRDPTLFRAITFLTPKQPWYTMLRTHHHPSQASPLGTGRQ